MDVKEFDLKTKKTIKRNFTEKEIADNSIVAGLHAPTTEDILKNNLAETEDIGTISRKLEEVIDYIENGTPISTQAKEWVQIRKDLRK